MTTCIYTLNCPLTGKIRYLGKSDNPFKRFKHHLRYAASVKSHKSNWILSLKSQGLKPAMELLDEVPVAEWQFWEREYIRVLRAIGVKLTNGTDGGEGAPHPLGKALSVEHRQKISTALLGKKRSAATRRRMRNAKLGRKRSAETCAKISASQRGKPSRNLGKTASVETRAKMRAAHLGKILSVEHRQRISAGKRILWALKNFKKGAKLITA